MASRQTTQRSGIGFRVMAGHTNSTPTIPADEPTVQIASSERTEKERKRADRKQGLSFVAPTTSGWRAEKIGFRLSVDIPRVISQSRLQSGLSPPRKAQDQSHTALLTTSCILHVEWHRVGAFVKIASRRCRPMVCRNDPLVATRPSPRDAPAYLGFYHLFPRFGAEVSVSDLSVQPVRELAGKLHRCSATAAR